MAHRLYKRKNKRGEAGRIWWCWGYAHGKRWHESTRCADLAAARKAAIDIERRRAAHDPSARALGLEQAINDGIAHRERLGRAANTLKNWRQCGGHLCRLLGHDVDVHDLDLVRLEAYYDARREESASPHTIALELKILRGALSHAAKRGGYRGSIDAIWPGDLVRDVYKPRDRWLPPSEVRALWLAIYPFRRDHLLGYVYTGARRRELETIVRGDPSHDPPIPESVDFVRGELHLRGTKTKRADRWVPIHPELRPVLERRLRETAPGEPLFPPWHWITHELDRAAAKAGIAPVVCTDFRRTFASWLAQAGVPMLTTARLMGHGSTKMIERVYAQLAPQTLADAVARLPWLAPAVRAVEER